MTALHTWIFPAARAWLWSATRSAQRACKVWYERREAMHRLGSLDDHMLKDLGISRDQIEMAVTRGRADWSC